MAADPRLVIVRRGHFATFELLTRTFADDPSVNIIWDRRMGERRRADGRQEGERRRTDRRRMPPDQWGPMNYMIAGHEHVIGQQNQ
ncbi:MAG TPA: hypothetical protein VGZ27_13565 [Vicinamibacterales bacterium]|nr:hypothetical protein [Vicinamibacterales bacterium]